MEILTQEPAAFVRPLPQRVVVAKYRESAIPLGGLGKAGPSDRRVLRRDLMRMKRHLMVDGQRKMVEFLRRYMTEKINAVADRLEEVARPRKSWGGKGEATISLGANEELWKEVIEEILGPGANVELVSEYTPIIQSTAAKAYERTSTFIGVQPDNGGTVGVLRRSQEMGRKITGINDTTRGRIVNSITSSMAEGKPLGAVAQALRDSVPEIGLNRIPTIVRTETGNACDEGTKQALLGSSSVTHIYVYGCTAIEPKGPRLAGVPTCNICGVPVGRMDELVFHPNHSGCLLPQFYTEDNYTGPIYSGGT